MIIKKLESFDARLKTIETLLGIREEKVATPKVAGGRPKGSKNKRKLTTPKQNYENILYKGEQKSLHEWSKITGLSYQTLWGRLRSGYTVERAFETPVRFSTLKGRKIVVQHN